MLFWWICGGESVLPILLLRHLGSSPWIFFLWVRVWLLIFLICWAAWPGADLFPGHDSWFLSPLPQTLLFSLPWICSSDPRLHIFLAHVLSHFGPVQLCDLMDCSLPGYSVRGILQARIPEWVAMPSSRRSSWLRDQTCVSCIAGRIFTTEWLGKPIIFFGVLESGNLVVAAASWEAHDHYFLMLKLDHWWTDAQSRAWPRGTSWVHIAFNDIDKLSSSQIE